MTLTKQELKYIAVSLMNTANHIDEETKTPFNSDKLRSLHERVKEEIEQTPDANDESTLPLPLNENERV